MPRKVQPLDSQGTFHFAIVPPSTYNLNVNTNGFQPQERARIVVAVERPAAADFQLQLAATSQELDVTAGASVLQTENAYVATTFSTEIVKNLRNPGNDLTYIAQTPPGVVMNIKPGVRRLC